MKHFLEVTQRASVLGIVIRGQAHKLNLPRERSGPSAMEIRIRLQTELFLSMTLLGGLGHRALLRLESLVFQS